MCNLYCKLRLALLLIVLPSIYRSGKHGRSRVRCGFLEEEREIFGSSYSVLQKAHRKWPRREVANIDLETVVERLFFT